LLGAQLHTVTLSTQVHVADAAANVVH